MTCEIDMEPRYNVPTGELLRKFPVEHETPATTELEKKVQNRLLNGFNTWNQGYDAWKHWGEVLYTPESMYNVHGARLTLAEYQMAMNLGLKVMDMQMGSFHNMVLVDDWTAIRYDVTSTDRRSGASSSFTVTEFVKFADHGEHGAKVVEGWGGVKDAGYDGMLHFQTAEEGEAQQELMGEILAAELPDTDNLAVKYPVLHPSAIPAGRGRQIADTVIALIDAWNKGADSLDAFLDAHFAADGSFDVNDRPLDLAGLKDRSHTVLAGNGERRVRVDNLLVSGDWAAVHYWAVAKVAGTEEVHESMEFIRFAGEGEDLEIDLLTLNTTPLPCGDDAAKDYTNATLEERLAHHAAMAESYHSAYTRQEVQGGATYAEWRFAPHATYWSPYFGDNMIDLSTNPMTVQESATMEATSYGVTLPDWAPLSFESWASADGFVMKTHFGGHDKEGILHDFYAYGFVRTNERDEIVHWETHVSPEYNDFLDFTLGVHGPFKHGADEYMAAVAKRLSQAGIDLSTFM